MIYICYMLALGGLICSVKALLRCSRLEDMIELLKLKIDLCEDDIEDMAEDISDLMDEVYEPEDDDEEE